VEAADADVVTATLAAIEAQLERLGNPLARGFAYAEVRAALGHPADAAAVLDDLLAVMGDHAVAYYQLGCYRKAAGDVAAAVQAFAKAAELEPTRVDAWLELGTLLDDQAEPQAAVEAYRQALRVAPSHIDVWRNLGNSLAALGKFDEAVSAYETGLGLHPGNRTLVLLRAAAHQAGGDIARANALTPTALTEEVGAVVEIVEGVWRCRYRTVPERLASAEQKAREVLRRVAAELGEAWSGPPQAHREVYVVRHGEALLVCDPDPIRRGHPHRFFDASELVR
jgi:tetratricopeptide (TPR) repeat protein